MKYSIGNVIPLSPTTDFLTLWQEQIAWEGISSQVHIDLMSHFNKMGLHGHKRMARVCARHEFEEQAWLSKLMVDNFDVIPDHEIEYTPSPFGASLKIILESEMTFYKENAARLDRLMKTAIEQNVNVAIKTIGCLIKKQYHSIYKLKRCIQRFEYTAWAAHDIHVVDDHLHKKFKCLEGKEGHKIS